jgi:hypothetical protein
VPPAQIDYAIHRRQHRLHSLHAARAKTTGGIMNKPTERQSQVDLEIAGAHMATILRNVARPDGEMLSLNVIASMDAARRNWDLALGRVRQVKHLTGGQAPSTALDIDQVRKDFQEGTLICRATIGLLIDALSAPAAEPTLPANEVEGLTETQVLSDDTLRHHFGLNGGAGPVSSKGW